MACFDDLIALVLADYFAGRVVGSAALAVRSYVEALFGLRHGFFFLFLLVPHSLFVDVLTADNKVWGAVVFGVIVVVVGSGIGGADAGNQSDTCR